MCHNSKKKTMSTIYQVHFPHLYLVLLSVSNVGRQRFDILNPASYPTIRNHNLDCVLSRNLSRKADPLIFRPGHVGKRLRIGQKLLFLPLPCKKIRNCPRRRDPVLESTACLIWGWSSSTFCFIPRFLPSACWSEMKDGAERAITRAKRVFREFPGCVMKWDLRNPGNPD